MGRIIIKICKFWACQHDFKTACFHFVFISGIWLWCALLNIIFSYWMHWLTLWSLNGTKCTQAWSFLQNSQWYKVTGLPIFLLVLWSHLDTKFSLCSKCFVFWLAVFTEWYKVYPSLIFSSKSPWYKVTGLPIFLLVLWSHLGTKFSLCSKCFVFWLAVFFPPKSDWTILYPY